MASTGQLPAGATASSVVASLVKEHFALSLPRIDDDGEVGYEKGAMGFYLRLPVAGDLALVQQVTELAPRTCALSSEEKVMKVRVHIADVNSNHLTREIATRNLS